MQSTLRTLLESRRTSLGIRNIAFEIRRHQNKDPGCRTESASFLRELQGKFSEAMVVFDYHGCGVEDVTPEELEESVEEELAGAGWRREDAAVIVIYPELEAWLFGGSFQRLQQLIGWPNTSPLADWFLQRGFLEQTNGKPDLPQAAMDALLSEARVPRSSNLFEQMAKRQSVARCQDRAFLKFRQTLLQWFPLA